MSLKQQIKDVRTFIRRLEKTWPAGLTVLPTADAVSLMNIAGNLSTEVVKALRDAQDDAVLNLAEGIGDGTLVNQAARIQQRLVGNYGARINTAAQTGQRQVDLGPAGSIVPFRAGYLVALRDYEGILIRLDEIQKAADEIPGLFTAMFKLGVFIAKVVIVAIKAVISVLKFVAGVVTAVFDFSTPLFLGLLAGAAILFGPPLYRKLRDRRGQKRLKAA